MEDLVLPVARHGGKSIFELGFLCQGHLSVSFVRSSPCWTRVCPGSSEPTEACADRTGNGSTPKPVLVGCRPCSLWPGP